MNQGFGAPHATQSPSKPTKQTTQQSPKIPDRLNHKFRGCLKRRYAPRRRYPTDLTDAQWALLAPLIPPPKPGGRPAKHDRRELVDAMLYWLRAGCAWRLLPHDFPPWRTVYHYWRVWRRQGLWERVLSRLRQQERRRQGRAPTPAR